MSNSSLGRMICLCMLLNAAVLPALADENAESSAGSKITSGQVESTDWAASKIAINDGEQVLSFKVNDRTVIQRGDDAISLSDIEIADPLSVEYKTDEQGGLLATRITDQNLGND